MYKKNKQKQQQKLPRRGKIGQLAGLARQERAEQGTTRQGRISTRQGNIRTGPELHTQGDYKGSK